MSICVVSYKGKSSAICTDKSVYTYARGVYEMGDRNILNSFTLRRARYKTVSRMGMQMLIALFSEANVSLRAKWIACLHNIHINSMCLTERKA